MKLVPPRYRRQAITLLQQFNIRGDELTWNSDGVIFVNQTSLPQSDIYILFPYLFKMKHPKTLPGFDDFVEKIIDMGLGHLIVKKKGRTANVSSIKSKTENSTNWWFLG